MIRFSDIEATALKISIKSSRLEARINNVAAYYAPAIGEQQTTVSWNNLPRTSWKSLSEQPLVIDLGKIVSLKGFTYAPLNEQAKPTMAYRYNFPPV